MRRTQRDMTATTKHCLQRACLYLVLPLSLMAAEHPDLSGHWQLNHEQSDDAQQKMQEAFGSGGRGGNRAEESGRRHRRDGQGGGMGGGQGGGLGRMMQAAETLQIQQKDPEVLLTLEQRTLTLYTDGRSEEQDGRRGGSVKTTSHWDDSQLMVEREMGRGMKVTTTYALSATGSQLFVTTRIETPRSSKPAVIRHVYDATNEPAAAPAKATPAAAPRSILV
jgi:hypothetical protein